MPSQSIAEQLYSELGFYVTPELRLPVALASIPGTTLQVSPLQMVLATATLSDEGIRPAPRLAIAVDTPTQGWVILSRCSEPVIVFPATSAARYSPGVNGKRTTFLAVERTGSPGQSELFLVAGRDTTRRARCATGSGGPTGGK